MLNKKDLFKCSGIAAAITGVVFMIHTKKQCKKEEQEMMKIMKDRADKEREVDEFLAKYLN
jgi:putative protein kinase ArgK-like GTPase of G3E family